MSLQYIIDGYNFIKHPHLTRIKNKDKNIRISLIKFIKEHNLTGSLKNKVCVVFDGYPDSQAITTDSSVDLLYSRQITADEKIKILVEKSVNKKSIIVVSDDKEIQFSVRQLGAKIIGIKEFVGQKEKIKNKKEEPIKAELTPSLMHKINQELRGIWLKE